MSRVASGALRWAPRLAALLLAGGYAAATVGAWAAVRPKSVEEWAGFGLMTTAVLAPLAGWKWRWQAAAVSLAALVGFALVAQPGRYDTLIVMAMPALLLLADWGTRRG